LRQRRPGTAAREFMVGAVDRSQTVAPAQILLRKTSLQLQEPHPGIALREYEYDADATRFERIQLKSKVVLQTYVQAASEVP
jgi:hypothetical protein